MVKKPNPLKKYNLSVKMREALFHAESGQEGYVTPKNHDMPADRVLDYQNPAVIRALERKQLIEWTGNLDFPWRLTEEGRWVGRQLVMDVSKKEYSSLPTP